MKIGLLGRTNVGKSTLFNKLIGNHRAIITDIAGTTRELLVDQVTISGMTYEIIDSPGLDSFEAEIPFLQHIIDTCDVLLFVVDGKEEIGQQDLVVKDMIFKSGKEHKAVLTVNKLDGKVYTDEVFSLLAEWYQLGFEHVVATSAEQTEGIDTVRTMIVSLMPDQEEQQEEEDYIPLAILGKPNAGKSTLINTLSGEWISVVSDTPGTTLDYLTAMMDYRGRKFKLYDTAGIRKKGKTVGLERIAYEKTKAMLKFARPVVVFVVDLAEGFTKRDATLLDEVQQYGLCCVLVFNKIDLFSKEEARERMQMIVRKNKYLQDTPYIGISAQEALGLDSMLKAVNTVHSRRTKRVSTGLLNKVLTKAWLLSPPRFPKNKICKWKYITQVSVTPPTFMLSVNNEDYANFSFKKWVINVIRRECDLVGVPIVLEFTSKVDDNPYTK